MIDNYYNVCQECGEPLNADGSCGNIAPPEVTTPHGRPPGRASDRRGLPYEARREESYPQGDQWSIWDPNIQQFVARMLPGWKANAAVWAWNHLMDRHYLSAVGSRFQVMPPSPSAPDSITDFYEGPRP